MTKRGFFSLLLAASIVVLNVNDAASQKKRMRDYGITYGIFNTGKYNAITDVEGVTVGQVTLCGSEDMRTGVTAILPHQGNIFRKVSADMIADPVEERGVFLFLRQKVRYFSPLVQ